jgi:anti-sigma factor RsiW
MTIPLTCAQLADQIDDYLTCRPARADRAAITRHLARCPDCRATAATFRLLRALRGTPQPSKQLEQHLLSEFHRWLHPPVIR